MLDFLKLFLGLMAVEKLVPGTTSFLNWFFYFPLAVFVMGGMSFCLGCLLFGLGYSLHNFALCTLLVGLPIGLLAAKA